MAWLAAVLLVLAAAPERVAVKPASQPSRARYILSRDASAGRGPAIPAHEAWGWSQRVRLLDDGRTEVTVVALTHGARPQLGASVRPPEAEVTLAGRAAIAPEVRALSEELAHGTTDAWTISERVLTWVSLNVRHVDAPDHAETALETLHARDASCVGRSVLAAALMHAAGVPARTVHGLLATPSEGRAFLLHRFVETWVDGVGWVPSDPGESVHVIDARHLFIAADDAPYDPESQRTLQLRVAEPMRAGLALPGARPLVTADAPPRRLPLPDVAR